MSLAAEKGIVLVAGRYEGVDERVIARQIDDEISIGDYVLSGGEVAAMVVMDSVIRQLPGVLGDAQSADQESFVGGLLDWPHYTRPELYEGVAVPPVLMSGNHADIARWRLKQALREVYVQAVQSNSAQTAEAALRAWLSWAKRSRLASLLATM